MKEGNKLTRMNVNKYVLYIRVTIGAVFITSGIAKAADSDYFASLLTLYGADIFYWLAPFIIFIEFILGLALLFGLYTKISALATALLLILFTAGYSYGLLFLDIKNCGCFGRMQILPNSPIIFYIRNIVIFCGLIYVSIKSPHNSTGSSMFTLLVCLSLTFSCAFICGNTFKWDRIHLKTLNKFEPIALSQHPLGHLIVTSADSTYMVTVFSYTCPHCLNSIGNMEQYAKFGIVDHTIGIALDNTAAEEEFKEYFHPSFCIYNYPFDTLSTLKVNFPTTFFIKHNYIIGVMSGEIPSAYFLRSMF